METEPSVFKEETKQKTLFLKLSSKKVKNVVKVGTESAILLVLLNLSMMNFL